MFGLKPGILYALYREKRRAGLSGQPALKQMKVGPFPVFFLCNAGESIALFRINQILFCGQVKRFLHVFSGLVAGHRQVVQQIGAAVAGCGSWHFAFKVSHELKRLLHQGQDVLARQVALYQQIVAR